MLIKKKKGGTLVWVIIVTAVLIILGTALLNIALADTKQTVYQEKKNQAHYMGQSGVYTGMKLLKERTNSGGYTNLASLCNDLNLDASSAAEINVGTSGSFKLKFSTNGTNEIKIESTGYSYGTKRASDVVTLTVRVALPNSNLIETNPEAWFKGNTINDNRQQELAHKITPSINFLGKMIRLDGGNKSIRYNQGGNDADSIFRASIIAFTSYGKGVPCFSQNSNKLSVTFDAEIIYFRDSIESSKGQDIILSVSDAVLNRPADGIIQPATESIKGFGFETFGRYSAFIKHYNSSITDAQLHTYWDTYNFNSSYGKYGIVCFMKDVGSIANNYYFFPGNGSNGMSILKSDNYENVLGYDGKLIPIKENDPIRDALDLIFSNAGSSNPYYWDNK